MGAENIFAENFAEFLEGYGFSANIAVIKIIGSGYRSLTHRDFLGSVLGLGIERSVIGDILITEADPAPYRQARGVYRLERGTTAEGIRADARDAGGNNDAPQHRASLKRPRSDRGYGISVSSGIVCVDSEYITMTAADGKTSVSFRVIRVDSAVNSGNSGGGLFDKDGNLIGIVNAKISSTNVLNK